MGKKRGKKGKQPGQQQQQQPAAATVEEKCLPDPLLSTLAKLHTAVKLGTSSKHIPAIYRPIQHQCRELQTLFTYFVDSDSSQFLDDTDLFRNLFRLGFNSILGGMTLETVLQDMSRYASDKFTGLPMLLHFLIGKQYMLQATAHLVQQKMPERIAASEKAIAAFEKIALPLDSCDSYLVLSHLCDLYFVLSNLTEGQKSVSLYQKALATTERLLVCPSTKREDKSSNVAKLITKYARDKRLADVHRLTVQYGDLVADTDIPAICSIISSHKEPEHIVSDDLLAWYRRTLNTENSGGLFLFLCELNDILNTYEDLAEDDAGRGNLRDNITALVGCVSREALAAKMAPYLQIQPSDDEEMQQRVKISCFVYGSLLLKGNEFIDQNVQQGVDYLMQAHRLGHAQATFILVHHYLDLGTPDSYFAAIDLLRDVLKPERADMTESMRYSAVGSLCHALALFAITRVDSSKPPEEYIQEEVAAIRHVINEIEQLTKTILTVPDATYPARTMETTKSMAETAMFFVTVVKLSVFHKAMGQEEKAQTIDQLEQFMADRDIPAIYLYLAKAYRDGYPTGNQYLEPNHQKAKHYFQKAIEGERTWEAALEFAIFWAKQPKAEAEEKGVGGGDTPSSVEYWRAEAMQLATEKGKAVECRRAFEVATSSDAQPAAPLAMPSIPFSPSTDKKPQAIIHDLLRQAELQQPAADAPEEKHAQYKAFVIQCMSRVDLQISQLGGQFDLIFRQLPRMAGLLAKAVTGEPKLTPKQYAAVLKHFSRFKIAYKDPKVTPFINAILRDINISALEMNERFQSLIAICRLRLPEELLLQQLQLYLNPIYCQPADFKLRTNAELTSLLQGFAYAVASVDSLAQLPDNVVNTVLLPLLAELERRAGLLQQYPFKQSQQGQIQHALSFLTPTLGLDIDSANLASLCQQYCALEQKGEGSPSGIQLKIHASLQRRTGAQHEVFIPSVGRRPDFVMSRTQGREQLVTAVGEYDGWPHGIYDCEGKWVACDMSTCLRDKTYSAHGIEVRKLQTHRHVHLDEAMVLQVANQVFRRIKSKGAQGEVDSHYGVYVERTAPIPKDSSPHQLGGSPSAMWTHGNKSFAHVAKSHSAMAPQALADDADAVVQDANVSATVVTKLDSQ